MVILRSQCTLQWCSPFSISFLQGLCTYRLYFRQAARRRRCYEVPAVVFVREERFLRARLLMKWYSLLVCSCGVLCVRRASYGRAIGGGWITRFVGHGRRVQSRHSAITHDLVRSAHEVLHLMHAAALGTGTLAFFLILFVTPFMFTYTDELWGFAQYAFESSIWLWIFCLVIAAVLAHTPRIWLSFFAAPLVGRSREDKVGRDAQSITWQ